MLKRKVCSAGTGKWSETGIENLRQVGEGKGVSLAAPLPEHHMASAVPAAEQTCCVSEGEEGRAACHCVEIPGQKARG